MNGNTHSFYQGIFFSVRTSTWEITFRIEERGWFVLNEFWAHSDPTDYSPPGSSVHEISQARILEWVAISFCRESSRPRDWTRSTALAGQLLYHYTASVSFYQTRKRVTYHVILKTHACECLCWSSEPAVYPWKAIATLTTVFLVS